MFKVGVTGGIGTGKSTVCKIFEAIGIPIFYADIEAKKLLETDEVRSFYSSEFGQQVFTRTILDPKKIANLIFSNKEAIQKVNSFVHPLVNKRFESWCNTIHNAPYIIKEAALLFESNLYKQLDYTILTIAPLEVKIERIVKRDGIKKESILERINNQWDDNKKIPLSNITIINDGKQALLPQVIEINEMIKTIINQKEI
jgi:dephospho-CoA kinase